MPFSTLSITMRRAGRSSWPPLGSRQFDRMVASVVIVEDKEEGALRRGEGRWLNSTAECDLKYPVGGYANKDIQVRRPGLRVYPP